MLVFCTSVPAQDAPLNIIMSEDWIFTGEEAANFTDGYLRMDPPPIVNQTLQGNWTYEILLAANSSYVLYLLQYDELNNMSYDKEYTGCGTLVVVHINTAEFLSSWVMIRLYSSLGPEFRLWFYIEH